MPNYFYFDQNGQKQGPIDDQQPQTLVVDGVITPETPLETESGHKEVAGQIPGLKFAAPTALTERSPILATMKKLWRCTREQCTWEMSRLSPIKWRQIAMIAGAVLLVLIGGWWMTSSKTGNIRESILADYQELERIGRKTEEGEEYFQQNHAKRRSDWIIAAKRGIPEGQYLYGYCFRYGTGEKQSDVEAFKWFRKAAEQGNVAAQHELGLCYTNGKGVAKDNAEAVKWWRKAAEQGDAGSQFLLSTYYMTGIGVAEDKAEAAKWLRRAAERDVKTQYLLGLYSSMGMFGAKDDVEAFKWFRKAAEQGHAAAQDFLGMCYLNGEGVRKDVAEAFKWFRKAAAQGYADSQFRLGMCYLEGVGVRENIDEGIKWLLKAEKQGHEGAKEFLNKHR